MEIISRAPLLINILLRSPLPNLPLIMNLPPLLFLLPISNNSSSNTTQLPLRAITHSFTKIFQLTLRLSLFTSSILFDALPADVLVADEVAHRLFCGTDGLVPGACVARGVVLGCGAGLGVGGYVAEFGGVVAGSMFGLGLVLGGLALSLFNY